MLQASLFRRRARVAFTTHAKRYGYVLGTIVHIALLSNLQPCRSNLGRDVTPNSRERKIDITTAPCAGQVLGFEAPADKCPAHHFSETRQRDHKDDAVTHGGPFFIFGRGSVVLMRVFFSFFFRLLSLLLSRACRRSLRDLQLRDLQLQPYNPIVFIWHVWTQRSE